MVDKFTAINFVTSYGEHCVATKNNGIVTIQGDKNGVRQMPYDEFMQAFVKDQAKVNLERSPQTDVVEFSSSKNLKVKEVDDKEIAELNKYVTVSKPAWYDMNHKSMVKGEGFDVETKDALLTGGRNVTGKICNRDVDITMTGGTFDLAKGKIQGTIDGQEVKLKYQGTKDGIKFEGEQDIDDSVLLHIGSLVTSYVTDLVAKDNAVAAAAIMSGKM